MRKQLENWKRLRWCYYFPKKMTKRSFVSQIYNLTDTLSWVRQVFLRLLDCLALHLLLPVDTKMTKEKNFNECNLYKFAVTPLVVPQNHLPRPFIKKYCNKCPRKSSHVWLNAEKTAWNLGISIDQSYDRQFNVQFRISWEEIGNLEGELWAFNVHAKGKTREICMRSYIIVVKGGSPHAQHKNLVDAFFN